ncbi:MAG: DNA gyrase subunit A [Synergistaceae bacterium]|nr:DNA gyrase subunit A [Synergistaceae bacterium]
MTKDSGERLDFGTILPLSLEEEIKHSYLDYAMSVIVGRALPDARDGLKPVQRRVLYAMLELGLRHNQAYKKSARVVGETMGKYHPHGDSAIYDTMARLAQDFSMRYPLVDGQGNFGSIDGDPPAAMRYTEARLASIGEEMLTNIDEETVDWSPNFDESLNEPRVLPSLIPNLLVNGSSGIAVGMATNIPPHNLGEVIDALGLLLENEQTELGELLAVMPGPDFPTGGVILGRDGIVDAYRTGRGRIVVRGKASVEDGRRGKGRVIITEIPYMVNKTNLIETIVKGVQNKTINGVTDIRDESDRKGLRIVLEISRDADPEVTLRQLYRRSQLQSTFGVINLALVDNQPRVLSLPEMLKIFLDHRRTVVRRRTEFRLRKAEERAHIVEGLVKALDVIDRVIALIRGSSDVNEARRGLVEDLAFSGAQAQAILDMRLQRLTGLERRKLEEELASLLADIERYRSILAHSAVLDGVVRDELEEIKKRFGDARRTHIADEVEEASEEDLIPESEIVVALSRDNFLRRMQLQDYRCQLKGGKGVKGVQPKGEDEVSLVSVTTTHRDLFLFTTRGRVFALKGYVIPEPKTGKGKHVSGFIPLEDGERVVALRDSHLDGARFVYFLTVQGIAKRIAVDELANLTRAGRRILGLAEGDEIARVHLTSGDDDIIITTAHGQALRVSEEEFRPLGRQARGVRAIRLAEGDRVVGCDVVREGKQMLCISELGLGKKTAYDQFSNHHRGGGGVKVMNLGDRTGLLVGSWGVREGDEVLVVSSRGRVIRFSVDDIPSLSRIARGSILVRLDEDDAVADVSVFRCDPKVE